MPYNIILSIIIASRHYYGYVRTTQDIDILVIPSVDNAQRLMRVLEEFGFGQAGIPPECFAKEGTAVHLGVEPNRIDLLTHLKGIASTAVLTRAQPVSYSGVKVNMISLQDLLLCKKSSSRTKDLADFEELQSICGQGR